MTTEERNLENEREIRLKTMMVMTGMDHLITAMDEQRQALDKAQEIHAEARTASQETSFSPEFTELFQGLLDKFNAIDEKLRSIQTAHFALQHSCSSATEVAQVALKSYQRGNPYLSKIDDILTQHSEHDTTEAIINSATDMISVARRDTEHFLSSLRNLSLNDHQHKHNATPMLDAELVQSANALQTAMNHFAAPALQGV